MPRDTPPSLAPAVRAAMRREFTVFFVAMTTAQKNWPAITDQEFVDALADSLLEMGKQRGLGIALTQTLVHDLQDRINHQLKPTP